MTCMRRATSRPIRPKPTTPSVLPAMSWASAGGGSRRAHAPLRANCEYSAKRRASAMIKTTVRSATAAVSTPGVLQTATPRAVAAATSMPS